MLLQEREASQAQLATSTAQASALQQELQGSRDEAQCLREEGAALRQQLRQQQEDTGQVKQALSDAQVQLAATQRELEQAKEMVSTVAEWGEPGPLFLTVHPSRPGMNTSGLVAGVPGCLRGLRGTGARPTLRLPTNTCPNTCLALLTLALCRPPAVRLRLTSGWLMLWVLLRQHSKRCKRSGAPTPACRSSCRPCNSSWHRWD